MPAESGGSVTSPGRRHLCRFFKPDRRMHTFKEFSIRTAVPADHPEIIAAQPEWWGGRNLTAMIPRLFLDHFHKTSYIAEKGGVLSAFLIGFDSPSYPEESYIHFAGVRPGHQGKGLGRHLYLHFFERCKKQERIFVKACTSPVNNNSIKFHRKMGFLFEEGDDSIDGIPVFHDYNRPGDPKVCFIRRL